MWTMSTYAAFAAEKYENADLFSLLCVLCDVQRQKCECESVWPTAGM